MDDMVVGAKNLLPQQRLGGGYIKSLRYYKDDISVENTFPTFIESRSARRNAISVHKNNEVIRVIVIRAKNI
jgi:hypothetical protein